MQVVGGQEATYRLRQACRKGIIPADEVDIDP